MDVETLTRLNTSLAEKASAVDGWYREQAADLAAANARAEHWRRLYFAEVERVAQARTAQIDAEARLEVAQYRLATYLGMDAAAAETAASAATLDSDGLSPVSAPTNPRTATADPEPTKEEK